MSAFAAMPPLSANSFEYICSLVRDRAGILYEPARSYLADARLIGVAEREGFSGVEDLVDKLRTLPYSSLHTKVVEAMLIHETSFFRDYGVFDALRREILPQLMAAKKVGQSLRIWSAACASGQEPYSLAMLLRDSFPSYVPPRGSILATDVSETILAYAREGRYNQLEANRGLPALMLVKNFQRHGNQWQIDETLRSWVEFRRMNLIEPWPVLPRVDLILLRSVLIYFDEETKRRALRLASRQLAPGGYLVLGGSETALGFEDILEPVRFGKVTCYRARGASA